MDLRDCLNACREANVDLDPNALAMMIGCLTSSAKNTQTYASSSNDLVMKGCARICKEFGIQVSQQDVACVAGIVAARGRHNKRQRIEEAKQKESPTTNDLSKEDLKSIFAKSFVGITDGILKNLEENYDVEGEALAWIKEMCHYTVPGGKMNRGLAVIDALRAITQEPLTSQQLEDAITLGWCIELLQAFFLVADDVMDRSKTRRGKPCWYLLPKVKEIAINDSFLLESFVFDTIRRRFEGRSPLKTTDLVNLFLEVTLQTEIGQLHDLTSQPMDGKPDLKRFTLKRYRQIVKYKTAFYSFYLPVACGMILGGVTRAEDFIVAKKICCSMGEYFQIQDDYLDCFGDPEVIGKIGTDIQDNKCSWLVVQALAKATTTQRSLLELHYGKHDDSSVEKVKILYRDLELEATYLRYEKESYVEIMGLISTTKTTPHEVFTSLLNRIYKRKK